MNDKDTQDCDFANLDNDQLTAIKSFEKEFNEKYSKHVYIMAFDRK